MQAQSQITFHCPNCQLKLQVPASMAGVSGPCPSCSSVISAPVPTPQAQPAAMAPVPTQASQAPVAASTPAPAPTPRAVPAAQPTPSQPQPAARQQPMPTQEPVVARLDPRTQNTAPQREPAARSTANSIERQVATQPPARKRSRWLSFVLPSMFAIAAVVLVLALLQALNFIDLIGMYEDKTRQASTSTDSSTEVVTDPAETTQLPSNDPVQTGEGLAPVGDEEPDANSSVPATSPDATEPVLPIHQDTRPKEGEFPTLHMPSGASNDSEDKDISPPPADPPPSSPSAPSVAESQPKKPDQPESTPNPQSAGFLANRTLEKFLTAKSLAERKPLLAESWRSEDQLRSSCLAKPLKEVISQVFIEQVPDPKNGNKQFLYFVVFKDPEEPRQRHTILVQICERPGRHQPLVHTDAFIDYYEKHLQTYAKSKDKTLRTFPCVVEARTANTSKEVSPEIRSDLVRFIVKDSPKGIPLFNVYLNKNSPLAKKNIGADKSFPYLVPRFCTMTFRWNLDDPNYPHIELVDIPSLSWEK